jgi:hypothetical protein
MTFRLRILTAPTVGEHWIPIHQVNADGTTTPYSAVLEYQAKAGDYVWWQAVEVVLPGGVM